ncbi:MAG: metallopeptidase TldD-related protein [Gammaproteobacteria bacterium]|nr:metallopeptidase TldD-related protein [Gammaproteobacteria bacterium]
MSGIRRVSVTCVLLISTFAAAEESTVLLQALQDELARSIEGLELEDVVKPHFIGYTVHTDRSITVNASKGGIENVNNDKSRRLEVEMRVGSRTLDNSNYMSRNFRNQRVNRTLALEDDYGLLRKQIWLATDNAYKDSIETYAAKEAAMKNSQQETTLDFSTEEPNVFIDERRSQKLDFVDVRNFARELSEVGQDEAFIYDSDVVAFTNQHTDTYLNSEGSHFTRRDDTAWIRVTAWSQSDDGRYVSDFLYIVGRAWKDIADLPKVKREVTAMHERLKATREAEPLDRYNGPVLFTGQAAAELAGQVLARNLINYKKPVFENDSVAAMFNRAMLVSTLKERLGARVLPRSWNVYDDPTQTTYKGIDLVGHYPVDSDGLLTRRVNLVENGILKMLLSDRNPSEDIQNSTASNATGAGPSVSNLFIEGTDGLSDDELTQLLLDIVEENGEEFGVRIDRAANPFVQISGVPSPYLGSQIGQAIPAISAYKVYPNGDEELVRHAVVRGNLLREMRNLPGYSSNISVHNSNYMFQGGDVSAFSGNVPVFVSIITPDILIEDASLSYMEGVVRSLPIVPHPHTN